MFDFSYIIEKINISPLSTLPFKHLYIDDLFSTEHFEAIISSPEIHAPVASTDEQLITNLLQEGFKPIPFPGCVTDSRKYLAWRRGKKNVKHHSACEGFGMALRLYEPKTEILNQINNFLLSREFNQAIASKFGLDLEACTVDTGIQKYLDGYEISPHPDIRKKAATFMVNINPNAHSESSDHHTHYLRFKDERKYVQSFWEGNPDINRCWVPWDWTETVFQQTKNNSIVIFAPNNDTIHGVKADYNHLLTQRTQLYGNLWFKEAKTIGVVNWEQLDYRAAVIAKSTQKSTKQLVAALLPHKIRSGVKRLLGEQNVGKRNI